MKKLINTILAKKGYEIRKVTNKSILTSLIFEKSKVQNFNFIQIGANDGVSFDPIHEYIKAFRFKGILLEPIPFNFEKLKHNYIGHENLIFLNKALVDSEQINKMSIWKPKINFKDWRKGIASFDKNHLIKCGLTEEQIESIEVETTTFKNLIKDYKISNLNLLVIDTEGYDYFLVRSFPFDTIIPQIIHFEHNVYSNNGMTQNELIELINILISKGYKINIDSSDCTAYI